MPRQQPVPPATSATLVPCQIEIQNSDNSFMHPQWFCMNSTVKRAKGNSAFVPVPGHFALRSQEAMESMESMESVEREHLISK